MAKVEVFDKPMCCSTGICGPEVDPTLPRFAADLAWLQTQGHQVVRSNLAQQPAAFAANETVRAALDAEGVDCLPLIVVGGNIVSRATYPTREQLEALANGVGERSETANALPTVGKSGGCCGDTGSC